MHNKLGILAEFFGLGKRVYSQHQHVIDYTLNKILYKGTRRPFATPTYTLNWGRVKVPTRTHSWDYGEV